MDVPLFVGTFVAGMLMFLAPCTLPIVPGYLAFIGALFALGWSPCIGPILGTVLLIASNTATAGYGAALLAVFSLGLGVPFLLTAVLVSETTAFLTRLSGLVRALTLIGGISLVVTGVLMVTGIMDTLVAGGYAMLGGWGYDALLNYL